MKLLQAEIENFGKFHGARLDFSSGLNTICRENGWGKTTLAVFLKAMLYGLPATTKTKLDQNERKKYAPWQGGSFGGSLTFQTVRGTFRVERTFGSKAADDTFLLRDLSTGMRSTVYSENLGIDLFGIDADGFERSVYLSERELDLANVGGSVQAKLTGVLEAENDLADLENALSILEKQRKIYQLSGNKGRVAELSRQLASQQELYANTLRRRDIQAKLERDFAEEQERLQNLRQRRDLAQKTYEQALQAGKQEEIANRVAELEARKKNAERQLAGLRAELGGAPPSPTEFESANRALNRITSNSAILDRNNRAEQADLARLATLNRQLSASLEPEKVYASVVKQMKALSDAESELRILQSRKFAASAPFGAKPIPSHAELDRQSKLLREAEELRQRPTASASGSILLILSILLLIVGGIALVAGTLLPDFRLPLLIGGSVLLAVGLLTAIVSLLRRKKNAASRIRLSRAQEIERQVSSYLSSYAITAPSLRAGLDRLQSLAEQARRGQQEESENKNRIQERIQTVNTLKGQISAQLEPFGLSSPDLASDLDILRQRIEERKRLDQTIADRKAENQALDQAVDRDLQQLDTLFSRAPGLSQLDSPDQKLRRMETLRDDFTRAQADLRDATQTLTEYTTAHPVSERGVPRQAPESCKADLDILCRETEDKEELLRGIKLQIDRLRQETDRLPELEESIETTKEDLGKAETNLKTILVTTALLQEARVSLSSRYLGKMQKHFAQYLSLLTKADAPETEFGADFAVSVRESGKTRSAEHYSRGWQDLFSFCARLSLVDALFDEGEQPFLLLDDPFSGLDTDHLREAKALLKELSKRFQIVYLVCHPDRS